MENELSIPKAFIFKRLHSITGVFLVLFLIEHLFVNSQAALFFGDDGSGFVRAANSIHDLPFLPLIEIFLLGVPILLHTWWGIQYIKTGEPNTYRDSGATPYLPDYPRNKAYTWQRITSWIILIGIIGHVIHMRFIDYPQSAQIGAMKSYMVRLKDDPGLDTLAARLGFETYNHAQVVQKKQSLINSEKVVSNDPNVIQQRQKQIRNWIEALEKYPLSQGEAIAVTHSFGTAELLIVRETFKMPLMIALYTLFVLATCFHAFNGLWTAMISWGITVTQASQKIALLCAKTLMVLIAFLGLAAIWGTYWINLKQ